jgi:bifunctional ADP-heptose synthase (sugar kinase/adenylyltransferase)
MKISKNHLAGDTFEINFIYTEDSSENIPLNKIIKSFSLDTNKQILKLDFDKDEFMSYNSSLTRTDLNEELNNIKSLLISFEDKTINCEEIIEMIIGRKYRYNFKFMCLNFV